MGDLLLLAVAVVWGSSYLTAKTLVAAGGVLVLLALRFLISAVALLPALAVRRSRGRFDRRELLVGVGLGVTQTSVLILETFGLSMTSATNAGVLISLTILMTPILEGFTRRRWLPPAFFGGAAAATLGVVFLVAGPGLRTPSAGDALMLAAAVVRAAHVTLSAHLTRGRSHDTATLAALQTLTGAVVCSTVAARALPAAVAAYGPAQWAAVTYLALGCSVFAFVVQLWAIRRTSASRASLLLGTEPVWAVLFGVALAGDRLTPAALLGIALVLAGTYYGQRLEGRSRAERSPTYARGNDIVRRTPRPRVGARSVRRSRGI
ncbi:permease [Actinoplanes sp. SE50]|uniref:DMT family transporter n=1 Tax=unclassified Actinoplanes TaxID=2626549 RepID=UPI00023EBEE0|nr:MULTISPECIES: DMT family transporter [unclassified Actinoplanes]AEV83492.1 putative transporter [Actinoplanes sp. SE50/110]ATO82365.1 permease [Actinoplanes sp. SE50]SLL99772.1 permease [Actinoplanes sp. SE50/110]